MLPYILRRLATGVVLALLVTMITFYLLSFSFDGVAANILGPQATSDAIAGLQEELGLDRPVMVQYFDWLGNVLQGDFGQSYFTSEPVLDAVRDRLPVTLSIVLVALVLSAIVSVVLGVLAASRAGVIDRTSQLISLSGLLFPNVLIAIVLVVVFAINLGWFPATGYTAFSEDPNEWRRSITLPVIVLVINGIANMAAQVRGAMIGELQKDYVRTLRSRGVPTRSVVYRHALRNAAAPALVVFSLEFVSMFGAALIIEDIFAIPGFGTFAFSSSLRGDIPVILGVTVMSVALVVSVNLLTDIINGWLNPKARVY